LTFSSILTNLWIFTPSERIMEDAGRAFFAASMLPPHLVLPNVEDNNVVEEASHPL
jgi:hypothetical protein